LAGAFSDKWFWITVVSIILIIALPLIVVWGILSLPGEVRLIATVAVILIWGVVSGYKDWVVSKRGQQARPETKDR